MWDLIVSVPDYCLSFYFTTDHPYAVALILFEFCDRRQRLFSYLMVW